LYDRACDTLDPPFRGDGSFIPPMINPLALTDDGEGLWNGEGRNPAATKAFLNDQDPEQTFRGPSTIVGCRRQTVNSHECLIIGIGRGVIMLFTPYSVSGIV
jgi:hypothetical protein